MSFLQIGVMGPSKMNYPSDVMLSKRLERYAEEVGGLLAEQNAAVLTGGCDGVMEAAMRGAKSKNGLAIGFPGQKFNQANPYCDIQMLLSFDVASFAYSGMLSSHALITFPVESAGTMLEIAAAYRHNIPNVLMTGFNPEFEKRHPEYYDAARIIPFYWADNPNEAVLQAINLGVMRK